MRSTQSFRMRRARALRPPSLRSVGSLSGDARPRGATGSEPTSRKYLGQFAKDQARYDRWLDEGQWVIKHCETYRPPSPRCSRMRLGRADEERCAYRLDRTGYARSRARTATMG